MGSLDLIKNSSHADGPASTYQPAPQTPEEQQYYTAQNALLQQQTDYLKQQMSQQSLLQPALLKQLGLQANPDGSYGPTQSATNSQTLQDLFTKQSIDALQGNLPVDPGLERDIGTQEQTLRESLRKNLGTGFETSTPGITALADFGKRADELRYNARRGVLGQNTSALGTLGTVQNQGVQGSYGALVSGGTGLLNSGTGLANTYSGPLSNMNSTNSSFLLGEQKNRLDYYGGLWKDIFGAF